MDDLNAAISAAAKEATTEVTGEPAAPASDPTPAAEPSKSDAPKEAAPPTKEPAKEEPEESFNVSAADLEIINKSPELKKAYRSMVKGFTAKTTDLANQRKTLEERAKVADWIQSDPDGAVETLARLRGKTLAQAKAEATDKVADGLQAKYEATMGAEAAKLLRPLFEDTAREIMQEIVQPLKQQTEQLAHAAAERGIAAGVAQFGAERAEAGEEWTEDIQAEMAKVMEKVEPGDEADLQDYLATLYDAVVARRSRARGVKEQLNRLRSAAASTEPTTTTRPIPRESEQITMDMSDNAAVALAVKQARESLQR